MIHQQETKNKILFFLGVDFYYTKLTAYVSQSSIITKVQQLWVTPLILPLYNREIFSKVSFDFSKACRSTKILCRKRVCFPRYVSIVFADSW